MQTCNAPTAQPSHGQIELLQDGHPMLQGFAGLSAAGMEPGYDKVNQDYICIQPLATADASSGTSYMFAVLDGHGAEGANRGLAFFGHIKLLRTCHATLLYCCKPHLLVLMAHVMRCCPHDCVKLRQQLQSSFHFQAGTEPHPGSSFGVQ